jgi:hypothetical protein
VTSLEKDLRPISLTPCISKVAEDFFVEDYVKPAILDIIDTSQYGVIPNSSTTMALMPLWRLACYITGLLTQMEMGHL